MGEGLTREIFELARVLGKTPECDWEALRLLCREARNRLAGQLRDGIEPQDCASAFVAAAAWTALADLCAGECADGVESFTAGKLSLRRGEKPLERSAGLRKLASAALGPYGKDGDFCFRGVRG